MRSSWCGITLIPGAAGASAFWAPIVERLDATFDARALDLPGLGSVPAQREIASYNDLADYAATQIRVPGVVVAQSMGAYVALRLALRYPHLVTGMILTAAAGGVGALACGAEDWRDDYVHAYPNAQPWARDHVRDLSDSELSMIAIPVLLLWAAHDVLSPLRVGERLAEKMPHARLVAFESDDHWFVHQFPDAVTKHIRAFTRQESPS